ncbi:DUF3024 domain-containing protein [Vibrio sp. SCSIO 43136]|uniref:DUF3024 domain-containing protein n=1 Tax=Vibrio sp. SCSIO 43136 TaxID=2819101 RepID=UPI002075A424|nr:DUF3024 domain-containing protein [Vibrio sp. SCSIO 43136]USD66883.1 DUF3024 domain-containing protein [Vibrio sp. SCSIO 43136]
MVVTELVHQRLEKLAHKLCERRNQSVPVEHGKAYCEMIESGVVFTKEFFLLDSSKPNYSSQVAKIEFEPNDQCWHLYIARRDQSGFQKVWSAHPSLAQESEFDPLLEVVEHDKEDFIWY